MQPKDIPNSDPIDRDNWRRSNHDLAILTMGHIAYLEGALFQNPYKMVIGIEQMLSILAFNFNEKIEGAPRKRGLDTEKYKGYAVRCIQIKKLVNMSLSLRGDVRSGPLTKAYNIAHTLGMEVLQDANRLGFDFKPKLDPHEAYKG